jgi:hypothetical protein
MVSEEELTAFRSLAPHLDTGEASCLAIARHRGWAFLSDDKLARKRAHAWQIQLSGTLGVLVQAVKRHPITAGAGDQLLQAMIQRGYRSPYHTLPPCSKTTHSHDRNLRSPPFVPDLHLQASKQPGRHRLRSLLPFVKFVQPVPSGNREL